MRQRVAMVCLALVWAVGVWAADPPTWNVPRLRGRVHADGVLDEPQYREAFRWAGFVEVDPRQNAPTPWRTELYLFSTDTALVVGVRCHDPDPGRVTRERYRRDEVSRADAVELTVDPTGEAKQAVVFVLTPENDVTDGLYDFATGSFDRSLDLVFAHGARPVADGWQAELVVPFSSLAFAPAETSKMLLLLQRQIPREDWVTVAMLPIDPSSEDPRDGMAYVLLDTAGVRAARSWHILPAWVGSKVHERPGKSSGASHLGVTAQWQPRQDWLLKATWRPDFSQVEADDTYQKINNRYPVYIREKRPFFLEGAESFRTPLRLFYSRNIVQPEWGVRVSHREDRLGLFAILAQERDVPAERFHLSGPPSDVTWAVVRGTWAVGHSGSFLGGTATLRRFGSSSNQVVAVDGVARGSRFAFSGQLAMARSTAPGVPAETGAAALVTGSYRFNRYWKTSASAGYISPDFRADAGFVVRTDRRHVSFTQEYSYQPEARRFFLRGFRAGLGWSREETTRGALVWDGMSGYANATLPHQLFVFTDAFLGREGFAGEEFPGLWGADLGAQWSEHPPFQPFLRYHRGRELLYGAHPFAGTSDGWSVGVRSTAGRWQGEVARSHYSFGDTARRQESWQATLAYVWDEHWSAKVFWVQDRLDLGDAGWSSRSRFVNALVIYRASVFSAIYLGANLSLDGERPAAEPGWQEARQDQVFVKVSWYF